MANDYRGPVPDRILVAQLNGTAKHHAKWRALTEEEETAAVAELRELAAGRTDLLAEVAGVVTGFYAGDLEEPQARTIAQLCIAAGADPEAIDGWIAVGRERRENARRPPFSGGLRSLRFRAAQADGRPGRHRSGGSRTACLACANAERPRPPWASGHIRTGPLSRRNAGLRAGMRPQTRRSRVKL